MALVLTAFVALGETGELWNGPAGTPRCENLVQTWMDEFDEGERAFFLRSAGFTCQGIDCTEAGTYEGKYGFHCAAKGAGGKGATSVRDPYVQYMLTGATAEFHSRKPCQFFHDIEADIGSPIAPNSSEAVASTCEDANQGTCEYPPVPSGMTKLPHTSMEIHEWKGLLMDVRGSPADQTRARSPTSFEARLPLSPTVPAPSVPASGVPAPTVPRTLRIAQMGNLNQVTPHLNHLDWRSAEDITHKPIWGVAGTVCDMSGDFSQPGAEQAFYNGGVLIEKTLGPHLTTRSFMFKNDADRAVAMQDARNEGLQYAKTFAGENGCDTEVVWEIKPMTGGGIEMELTVPLDGTTCETEQGLRDGVAVYHTGEEVVVLVQKAALRAAHFLDTTCAADGYKEVLRFASNFICKADGSTVTADILYLNDQGTPYAPDPAARSAALGTTTHDGQTVLALSQDRSNPTPFFTGTGVDYLGPSGVCTVGGERPHGSKFRITASAADAPESCQSFYWDPLLQAVDGDGIGFSGPQSASGGSDEDEVMIYAIVGGVVGALALIGGTIAYVKCAKKPAKVSSGQTV